ncbi:MULTISPECIES: ribonuclease III [Dokdonia]|jgi:ribonuclease-3|uniref:Ribonuclease 3 n=3 Tax=Dokdonia TaxID=326319 RepID=A0A0A2H2P8_9FLAO|nr:ribonuclease III [Dokdonia donghaensis]AOE08743.1 ribonuclease III [uncultured bacterium]CCG00820.1 ribonuclease III [uncultured Dokdonia sp.]ANH59505.1 Ribonuclease 3 [Dokdonia donghaensis DSW-1]KGO06885.1 ribonuclease III [Dokdonia donghaensis DSW-1]MDE0598279.1 ribonuclease III [Dokdonia donghaensis]
MSTFKKIFNSRAEKDGSFFMRMQSIIGFKPKNIAIYEKAFTHRSLGLKKEDGNPLNYERLEFLGDAMLGSVIAAHLFNEVQGGNEGYLTKMRSKVVSRKHLNELGRDLNLVRYVKASIPIDNFGANIHGNLFEALVGAIYLDRGYRYCEKFIAKRVIEPYVDIEKLEGRIISYKSVLIEWCQKEKHIFKFETFEDTGQDAVKHFGVRLHIDGKIIAKARATSKKKAEEIASKRAFYAYQREIESQ